MSVLVDVINDNSKAIEEDIEYFIENELSKLGVEGLNIDATFSVQAGYKNGWTNNIVFGVFVNIYNDNDLNFDFEYECHELGSDDFESNVRNILKTEFSK